MSSTNIPPIQAKFFPFIENVPEYTVYFLAVLAPIFFVPATPDFFDYNKQVLVFTITAVVVLLWSIKTISKRVLRITLSPFTIPILGVLLSYILSSFIATPYRYEALMGRTLLVSALAAFVFTITTLGKRLNSSTLLTCLGVSGVVFSLVAGLEQYGSLLSKGIAFLLRLQSVNQPFLHLAGSVVAGLSFLIPVALANSVATILEKSPTRKIVHGVLTLLLAVGIVFHVFLLSPSKPTHFSLLPFSISWSIAVDTLKSTKTAIFGFGPESFLAAFTQFRPVRMNLLSVWQNRYGESGNEVMQVITTLGLAGFAAWALLVALVAYAVPRKISERTAPLLALLVAIFIEFFFVPSNTLLTTLLFLGLTALVLMWKEDKQHAVSDLIIHLFAIKIVSPDAQRIEKHAASTLLAIVVGSLVIAGTVFSTIAVGRAYAGERIFFQSLVSAQKNDISNWYDLQRNLVTKYPRVDQYHRTFATTNFAIANAIAANTQSTPDDKGKIPQLIQQAISEAKIAANIDQRNVLNWESLASIYGSLVGIAQDADQWAVAAYVRAIQTDSTNPALRLALGRVYLQGKNYEQSIRLFQQAVELKPDWANAQFNLGTAYEQKGDIEAAIAAFKQTIQLLPADSSDRVEVEKKLNSLTKPMTSPTPTTPTPTTSTTPKNTTSAPGEIRLPSDLGLPTASPPTTTPSR